MVVVGWLMHRGALTTPRFICLFYLMDNMGEKRMTNIGKVGKHSLIECSMYHNTIGMLKICFEGVST